MHTTLSMIVTTVRYKPPDQLTEIFRQGLVEGDKQVGLNYKLFSNFGFAGHLPSDGVAVAAAGAVGEEGLPCQVPRQARCPS